MSMLCHAESDTSPGTAAGTLSIINNDPNEASFDISLTGVVNAVMVKDDGHSGYSVVSGTWQGPSNSGYNNDHYFSWFNNGAVEWQDSPADKHGRRVSDESLAHESMD